MERQRNHGQGGDRRRRSGKKQEIDVEAQFQGIWDIPASENVTSAHTLNNGDANSKSQSFSNSTQTRNEIDPTDFFEDF